MDERPVQCEFFIPIVRNSDKQAHQPTAWNLLGNEIRRAFPPGHSGPETFYRGDTLIPGEYEDNPGDPPITDTSRRGASTTPAASGNHVRPEGDLPFGQGRC